MKERPILFSSAMVRAILEGRKTQTRRVINPQPRSTCCTGGVIDKPISPTDIWHLAGYENTWGFRSSSTGVALSGAWKCHYGQPGDRLWVRETYRIASINARTASQFWTIQFKEGFGVLPHPQPERELFLPLVERDEFTESNTGIDFGKWRPSIHMPRWASRITLEVVSVRVERLQDISDDDAVAEGVKDLCHCGDYVQDHGYHSGHGAVSMPGYARDEFSGLWDSINAKRGYSWESNPWVWVIEFKRV